MKIKITPCVCSPDERDGSKSIYYGMPALRVTDVNDFSGNQYYEAYCPNCGRGGCGYQYKSAYLALKHWNELQEKCRRMESKWLFVDDLEESE